MRGKARLILLGVFVGLVGAGVVGILRIGCAGWVDATYQTLQFFGSNFDVERSCPSPFPLWPWSAPPADLPLLVEVARFGAIVLVASGVIWLLLLKPLWTGIRLRWQIEFEADRRIVVIGAGPLGREVVRRFRDRPLTLVDIAPDAAAEAAAERDGALLIAGDGSEPAVLDRLGLRRAARIYVALSPDMATLDAAHAVIRALDRAGAYRGNAIRPDLRVLVRDPEIAREIADGGATGVGIWNRAAVYALPRMAAERLSFDARFDRVALEMGQARVHLVLFGCGGQGEAVLTETLLSVWRPELGPPRITVFDRSAPAIEARMRRRAPALFLSETDDGALPGAAAPALAFHSAEFETIDFATDPTFRAALAVPVTGYVFASGDDTLNLATALALETQMMARQVPAAPIRVRLWNGNAGDTADPGFGLVSLVRPFGSLESIVADGAAFQDDPDAGPRLLHEAYLAEGRRKSAAAPAGWAWGEVSWDDLSETKRESNRRLWRTAEAKLEGLGLAWIRKPAALPFLSADIADAVDAVRTRLDPAAIGGDGALRASWDRQAGRPAVSGLAETAASIARMAVSEHDRWMTDRAIDGWRAAPAADPALRDEVRRIHPFLCSWQALDAGTRQYDVAFACRLAGRRAPPPRKRLFPTAPPEVARRRTVARLWLALTPTAPAGADHPFELSAVWVGGPPGPGVTEVVIGLGIPAAPLPFEGVVRGRFLTRRQRQSGIDVAGRLLRRRLADTLAAAGVGGDLLRVRFVFPEPPAPHVLVLANDLADWLRHHCGPTRTDGPEISATWLWRDGPAPALGVVGHRDLDRVGGAAAVTVPLRDALIGAVLDGHATRLVVGAADGADRLAIALWRAAGLPDPLVIFPHATADRFHTDEPPADAGVSAAEVRRLGTPLLAPRRPGESGHEAQARAIIERAALLIAVAADDGVRLPGGTADTLAKARERGLPVTVIGR